MSIADTSGSMHNPDLEGKPEHAPLRRHVTMVTLLCAVAVAFSSFIAWRANTDATERMAKLRANWLPAVTTLYRLEEGLTSLRFMTAGLIEKGSDQTPSYQLDGVRDRVKQSIDAYRGYAASDDQRVLFTRVEMATGSYLTLNSRAIDAVRQQKTADATALFTGEMGKLFSDVIAAVDEARATEQSLAEKAVTDLATRYAQAIVLISASVASLSVLMLASLALLSRQLGRPLSSLALSLDVLSRGKPVTDPDIKPTSDLAPFARMFARLRTSLEAKAALISEMRLFAEFRQWLNMSKTEDELMKVTGEVASRLMPDMKGSLFVMSASKKGLERARVWNGGAGPESLGLDDCWSLRRGSTYTYGEGELDQCCPHAHDHGPEAYCCIPLRAHGDLVGLLHVELKKQPGATKEHRDITMAERRRTATACAEHLALAISNLRLREDVRRLTLSEDEAAREELASLEAEADANMSVEISRYQLAREYVDEDAERIICSVS